MRNGHVPTPAEVNGSGVYGRERCCAPGESAARQAAAVAEVLADLDRRFALPPSALAREIAVEVVQCFRQDPALLRDLAREIAREAVAEARRLRESNGG